MAIDRREALKRTALMMGGALSAPTLLSILQGCSATPEPNWKPAFFTQEQALNIMEMAETIMPATDTPGAKALGVPAFIEQMVNEVYLSADKIKFMKGLDTLISECEEKMGSSFYELAEEERYAFLNTKNEELKASLNSPEKPFFWSLKELTLLGYFTTEVGCTQVLQHVLVPGRYDACAPLQEVGEGRTWAQI